MSKPGLSVSLNDPVRLVLNRIAERDDVTASEVVRRSRHAAVK